MVDEKSKFNQFKLIIFNLRNKIGVINYRPFNFYFSKLNLHTVCLLYSSWSTWTNNAILILDAVSKILLHIKMFPIQKNGLTIAGNHARQGLQSYCWLIVRCWVLSNMHCIPTLFLYHYGIRTKPQNKHLINP